MNDISQIHFRYMTGNLTTFTKFDAGPYPNIFFVVWKEMDGIVKEKLCAVLWILLQN